MTKAQLQDEIKRLTNEINNAHNQIKTLEIELDNQYNKGVWVSNSDYALLEVKANLAEPRALANEKLLIIIENLTSK